ncbi:hypothetical protein [Alicyclobacillus sp. ALC3]|uniref:hypothetical protein n=1 Tax=Alicyclobacillus sp. ALC3 TaxID=2796143 RepID=UPI00237885F6|nr:hypothetical protein [Alicyclobacillus sp. ALC3]WDL96200.1 hypothetical protein JC200_17955 [Alicyclobacillus sp. ALC3]
MFVVRWKIIVGIVSVVFATYAASQAIAIAQAGVANQIPQLEGDGGGALLFAVVLATAGIAGMWKAIIALPLYAITLIIGVLVALIYQDLMLWFWDFGVLILGAATVFGARQAQQRRRQPGAA